ncbi:hypothetical protein CORC01_01996 [Colletotrichum orchidophilum]|uniref:Uncharacterized protein n=1 Tax=Colletotrichum orchidophilum TaxID=1209926 RepID=A0A1G4BMA8_9PEZI|nr:uncharacterized protein CORC01_01996 [Colletotrichum orchidophilum]OHF02600.1 hypothetical protein CORC01_01996 [Colletotrichum orchidophilum]
MPQLDIPTGGLQETTLTPPEATPQAHPCCLHYSKARKLKALSGQSPYCLDSQMSLHFSGFHLLKYVDEVGVSRTGLAEDEARVATWTAKRWADSILWQ